MCVLNPFEKFRKYSALRKNEIFRIVFVILKGLTLVMFIIIANQIFQRRDRKSINC